MQLLLCVALFPRHDEKGPVEVRTSHKASRRRRHRPVRGQQLVVAAREHDPEFRSYRPQHVRKCGAILIGKPDVGDENVEGPVIGYGQASAASPSLKHTVSEVFSSISALFIRIRPSSSTGSMRSLRSGPHSSTAAGVGRGVTDSLDCWTRLASICLTLRARD